MDTASTSRKIPVWVKLCQWIGLACLGQFLIVAIIGVLRGYSVQSFIPIWVMLGGYLPLFSFQLYDGWMSDVYKDKKQSSWISYVSSFSIIFLSIPGILQGRCQTRGDEFYKQKNYPTAIAMYQKELDTWYLRLCYNYREDTSLFGIAQSYCQLENFEQARQTYQRLHKMARGYYKERSQTELAELDSELRNIAEFEKQFANSADDNQKAQILFDMAFAYRRIECSKKANELYARIQTLDIQQIRKEQAKEFAADCV
ncbi:MAG: tetratricopeptide repeat protein [Anaerohalosphaeraceae bacterium]